MSSKKLCIELATEFPYHGQQPKDKAETAALAVLADLLDRRGVRQELEQVDEECRIDIVNALADILREVYGA